MARQLIAEQATVFGVVGNGNIHIVSDFHRAGGRYVSTRHEAGAVAAADAYFRATGRVAVATSTYGPGFSNALTPLSEAQAARIPLVYITADAPASGLRSIDIDQRAIAEALGLESVVVTEEHRRDVRLASQLVAEAFATARSTCRPVVIFVPFDLMVAEGAVGDPEHVAVAGSAEIQRRQWTLAGDGAGGGAGAGVDVGVGAGAEGEYPAIGSAPGTRSGENTDEQLGELAERINSAERPLFLVGRGAVDTGVAGQIDALAARVGALTATSVMARSSVDEEWNLGIAGGFAHRGRLELFRAADLVVVFGASLNKLQMRAGTLFGEGAHVVRIDNEPYHKPFIAVDTEITEDLRTAVAHLSGTVEACDGGWRAEVGQLPVEETEELDPGCFAQVADDGRLDPRHVLRRLDALLPAQRSVVTDGGHFLGWVPKYMSAPDPRGTILVGTAVMTIGLGLSSGVGVAAARPDHYTALISGDGGSLMGLSDLQPFLHTVDNNPAGGALIVLNDAAYGAEVHQYATKGLDLSPMEVPAVDFAAAGAPFGVPGITVTTPEELEDGGALAQFLAEHEGQAVIVDVKISRLPVADFLKEL
ncbi:MAG TPA: hypothetical protein H9867_00360 [Candidatus Corynebacterium gallistercoris]|uniref:acetolactate synthase n=1 Tax=Candidatus Corynebacterium gallistercoris TaxID=2838530 RepID=A0A9D1UP58_9CORY|nr:hypothetical protein [Candidatus Corynebacterium gallistercoris]